MSVNYHKNKKTFMCSSEKKKKHPKCQSMVLIFGFPSGFNIKRHVGAETTDRLGISTYVVVVDHPERITMITWKVHPEKWDFWL